MLRPQIKHHIPCIHVRPFILLWSYCYFVINNYDHFIIVVIVVTLQDSTKPSQPFFLSLLRVSSFTDAINCFAASSTPCMRQLMWRGSEERAVERREGEKRKRGEERSDDQTRIAPVLRPKSSSLCLDNLSTHQMQEHAQPNHSNNEWRQFVACVRSRKCACGRIYERACVFACVHWSPTLTKLSAAFATPAAAPGSWGGGSAFRSCITITKSTSCDTESDSVSVICLTAKKR